MLVPYGLFEIEKQLFQKLYDALATSQCIYGATVLMNALTYPDFEEFEAVVIKAQNACISLHIPLELHFRTVYISRPDGLFRDYRLSRFACYLVTINADSSYPGVVKAQAHIVMRINS